MVILFVIFLNYKEGIRAPIVLALHINVSECKLCSDDEMSFQTIMPVRVQLSLALKGMLKQNTNYCPTNKANVEQLLKKRPECNECNEYVKGTKESMLK